MNHAAEKEPCTICCQERQFDYVGSCRHPICFECGVRLRLICGSNDCPICRADLKKVSFYHIFLVFIHCAMHFRWPSSRRTRVLSTPWKPNCAPMVCELTDGISETKRLWKRCATFWRMFALFARAGKLYLCINDTCLSCVHRRKFPFTFAFLKTRLGGIGIFWWWLRFG